MPYIQVIPYSDAEGPLKNIYDHIISTRGKLAEVHKIQSLNPESITRHMDLYMTVMFGSSPLKRVQREMIAVVVSKANACEYCQVHHAEAVQHFWKDAAKTEQLKADYKQLNLSPVDRMLCDLAWNLTKSPGGHGDDSHLQPLREKGLSDRAILDATLVIAYFNFVIPLVMCLGVGREQDNGAGGYAYD